MYTGWAPFATQIVAEVVAPSKGMLAKEDSQQQGLKAFDMYSRTKLRKNPEMTTQELVDGYIKERADTQFLQLEALLGMMNVNTRNA